MIAVVQTRLGAPCPIKWVGRRGLSVKAITYCGAEVSVADGVSQVADATKLCDACNARLKA